MTAADLNPIKQGYQFLGKSTCITILTQICIKAYRCDHDPHHLEHLPEITILGVKEDPLLAFLLSVALRLVVFNNPFDGLSYEAGAASDKNDRRHDVDE